MSYQVVVPLVLAKDKEGKVHERYESAVIDWLSDEQRRHFLEAGLVVELDDAAATDEADADGGDGEEWPDESWKRDDIDAFAAERGIDTTGEPNKAAALERLNAESE